MLYYTGYTAPCILVLVLKLFLYFNLYKVLYCTLITHTDTNFSQILYV
jgi:hypothetical protein